MLMCVKICRKLSLKTDDEKFFKFFGQFPAYKKPTPCGSLRIKNPACLSS